MMNLNWLDISAVGLVVVGGQTISGDPVLGSVDLDTIIIMSVLASTASAGVRFSESKIKDWKSALISVALGAPTGILLAHLVILMLKLDPAIMLSLAPILSLAGAKFARSFISSDKVVDGLIDRLHRRLSGNGK